MFKLDSHAALSFPFFVVTSMLVACSAGGRTPDHCTPGAVVACACPGGSSGTQSCDASGVLGTCLGFSGADAGPHRDGGAVRCGDGVCSAGESCASCGGDCGACGGCSVSPGLSCTTPSMCCGDTGHTLQGTCANLQDGSGAICRGLCVADSECTSGCCYGLNDGTGACGAAGLGLAGSPCSSSTCCGGGLSCIGGTCQAECLPAGASCSSTLDCCGDSVCANVYGTGYVCHAHCLHGSDCTSGCCYVLNDGTGACATTLLAPSGAWCDSSACCEGALLCSGGACR